jgi:hypothetical protein
MSNVLQHRRRDLALHRAIPDRRTTVNGLLPSWYMAARAKKQRARDRWSLVTSQRWSAFKQLHARPGRLG